MLQTVSEARRRLHEPWEIRIMKGSSPFVLAVVLVLIGVRPSIADEQATDLQRQAVEHQHAGDLDQAEACYLKAIARLEALAERSNQSLPLSNLHLVLGNLYQRLGRFDEAKEQLTQAQRLCDQRPGDPDWRVAQVKHGIAEAFRAMGHEERAEKTYKSALDIWCAAGLRNPVIEAIHKYGEALSLGGLAMIYSDRARDRRNPRRMEDARLAQKTHREAIEVFKAVRPVFRQAPVLQANWSNFEKARATCLNNFGRLCCDLGREGRSPEENFETAREMFAESLDIMKRQGGAAQHEIADTLHNVALLELFMGDPDAARQKLDEAFELLGANPTAPLEFRFKLHRLHAEILIESNEHEAARGALRRAIDIALEQRTRGGGTPTDRALYFTRMLNAVERLLDISQGSESSDADVLDAFNQVERARALSFRDEVLLHDDEPLLTQISDELRDREKESRAKLAKLTVTKLTLDAKSEARGADRQKATEDLKRQCQEYADVRREIYRHVTGSDAASGGQHKAVTLDRLQAWAKEHKALVLEYYFGEKSLYVLAVDAEKVELSKLAISPEELQEQLTGDKGVVAETARSAEFEFEKDRKRIGLSNIPKLEELWRQLIPKPIRAKLTGDKKPDLLVIAPDGVLAVLPFEMLIVDRPDQFSEKYLLDVGPPVMYAPSTSVLLSSDEKSAPGADLPGKALLLGDIHHKPWKDLGKSKEEVDDVAEALGKKRVTTLLGEQATEREFCKNASNCRWILLSCHGGAGKDYGNLTGHLVLTPGGDDAADDGLLLSTEIHELDLEGCELVALSACETNYGPTQQAEGVWSLARAFRVAGARRVVASGWKVDDHSTSELMKAFFKAVGKPGVNYAKALQQAKQDIRNGRIERGGPKHQYPYYWAPFVLVGPP